MANELFQEYFNQGEVLLASGKVTEAMEYFKKAEKEDPNHKELYINMGIIHANQGNLDEAEKTFKKALYVEKKYGEAYFHLGCIAGLKDDFAEAVKYIDMARTNGYENAQLFYTLGMMYEEQDNVNMALRNYNKALSMEPVRADINLQKLSLLIQKGRREEAVEAAGVMIANCPDYFEGYHLKCGLLIEAGKFGEAEEVLAQGLEMFPEEIGFMIDQAKILIAQQKYQEAEAKLSSLEGKAGHWKRELTMERIRVAGLQEDFEKTQMLLEKAYAEIRSEDGRPDEEICYLLMSVLMNAKRYDKVIVYAKTLMELTDNSTYVNIAHFYYAESLKKCERAEADAAFREAIARCRATSLENPAALDAYLLRALSHNRLGENEKALELIDYVVALAPDSAEVHSAKAVILKDMGRTEELQKEIDKVNSLSTNLGAIMSVL